MCPLCKQNFEKAIFYGVEVDYCSKCLGLWFEEDELRLAKDEKDKDLNWLDVDLWHDKTKFRISKGLRYCPSCRMPMYEVFYGDSKIVVDLCNVCHGVWLDRGEFKKIIEYLKKKANWEVIHNYAKNFTVEFWEVFAGPESFRDELLDFLTILKLLSHKFASQKPSLTKIITSLPR